MSKEVDVEGHWRNTSYGRVWIDPFKRNKPKQKKTKIIPSTGTKPRIVSQLLEKQLLLTNSQLNDRLPTSRNSYMREYIAINSDSSKEWIQVSSDSYIPFLTRLPIGTELEFREGGSHNYNYAYRFTKTKYGWINTEKKNFPSSYSRSRTARSEAYWKRITNKETISKVLNNR